MAGETDSGCDAVTGGANVGNNGPGFVWQPGGCARSFPNDDWNCNPGNWATTTSCQLDPYDCLGDYVGPGDDGFDPHCRPIKSCFASLPSACAHPIGATKPVNDIIDKDKHLQALLTRLQDKGLTFSVHVGAIPATVPHDANSAAVAQVDFSKGGKGNVLYVDMDTLAAAVLSGQDAGQIFFMELEHFYYGTLPTVGPRAMPIRFAPPGTGGDPGIATAVIGGTTYTFDMHLVDTLDPTGKVISQAVSPGYFDEQHAVIHNDIVDVYGSDKTGAAAEATGHQPKDQWTKDNADNKFILDSDHTYPAPDLSHNCVNDANTATGAKRGADELIDDGSGPPIDFAYFWAEF